MPALRDFPESGRFRFAPAETYFELLPGTPVLSGGRNGATTVGIAFGSSPTVYEKTFVLDWIASARLLAVDARGRVMGTLARRELRMGSLLARRFDRVKLALKMPRQALSRSGFYRLDVRFQEQDGEPLGAFSRYLRVMRSRLAARLVLDKNVVHPGEEVFFRALNDGTQIVYYGPRFWLERYDGSGWIQQPDPGPHNWPALTLRLFAGEAGGCESFTVPADLAPGGYRIKQDLSGARKPMTARFEVRPCSGELTCHTRPGNGENP